MSVNTQPIFPGSCAPKSGVLSTANTNRDGTGSFLDFTAPDATNGAIAARISAISAGAISVATSDNIIRMWSKVGSTYRLLAEYAIATATPSATVAGSTLPGTTTDDPWLTINLALAAAEVLSFSIHTVAGTQDNYHVRVEFGPYSAS